MAVNLDTSIPLSAIYDGPTGTERRQASQANELALRLNELKLDYENRKRKRESDTDRFMGESLKRIQQGTPEQAVTDFNWNLPQQPAPMRGPMLDAPAYQRPEPLLDVQRRVTAPAVAGRQPNMDDMYSASIDALFRAGDYQGAFDAMKAMRSGQVSQMKAYGGMTKTGTDGLEYAFNQATGQYEPTGFQAQADAQKPERPQMVKTARGIEFVTPTPGMVLQPPPEPVKAEKPAPVKEPTVDENKNAGFYLRMRGVGESMRALEKTGGPTMATSVAGSLPFIGGYARQSAMTEDQQQYYNSAMAWIRAKLRKESGAVIGDDEAKEEWNTYFPVPGNTEKTIRQKERLRALAEEEMKISAGRAAGQVDAKYDRKPRNTTAAVGFLKTQKIDSQAKFEAAVRKLKVSGWSDEEIREAANKAGL